MTSPQTVNIYASVSDFGLYCIALNTIVALDVRSKIIVPNLK